MYLKVKRLTGLWSKSIGLIGQKNITPVYFNTRFGIHTFGVMSPIDILILDKWGRVVKMKSNLKPNRLFFWPLAYDYVVELPAGEIKKQKFCLGQRIELVETYAFSL